MVSPTTMAAIRASGATPNADYLLSAHGIRGNTHMLMMERNNREIAALVRRWLQARGLEQAPAPAARAFGGGTPFAG